MDKHDHVHQAGATAWSLRPNVPEGHLLIPEDVIPGNPLGHGIRIGILHAFPNPFSNGICLQINFSMMIL